MSLPAGWASDRFGAPLMMVVMFVGHRPVVDRLRPGADRRHASRSMLALCGIGVFGAIYHSVGIGWIIRTAREQGHAMGVNGLWGSAGLALYGIVPGVLITLASWRAAFIVPGIVCIVVGAVLAWQIRHGRVGDRPMPATPGVQTGRARVLARLLRALGHHGARRHHLAGGDVRRRPGLRDAAGRRHRGPARRTRVVGHGHPGGAVGRPRDLDDLRRLGHRAVRHGPHASSTAIR